MVFWLLETKCAICKAYFKTYKYNPYLICQPCRVEYRKLLKEGKVSDYGRSVVERWLKIDK